MELIETEGITGWSYTPTMLHRDRHHPRLAELRPQRAAPGRRRRRRVLAGAPRAGPRPRSRTSASSMGVGYGQTECAALATINAGEELVAFPESVGRPLPTIELEIRGDDGHAAPRRRGRRDLRAGPDRDARATGAVPRRRRRRSLPGGWLRTGDVGRLEGGRLYLATRKRDLILRGGENVYPMEIENRLEAHPDVAEVAVVGVDDEVLGQEVKAIVVPMPGASLDPDAARAPSAPRRSRTTRCRRTGRCDASRCRGTRSARWSRRCSDRSRRDAVRRGVTPRAPGSRRALVAPAHTALVLQEVQNGVVGEPSVLPELAAAAAPDRSRSPIAPRSRRGRARPRDPGVPLHRRDPRRPRRGEPQRPPVRRRPQGAGAAVARARPRSGSPPRSASTPRDVVLPATTGSAR